MNISKKTKKNIIDTLRVENIQWHGSLDEISFLERVFNLDELPGYIDFPAGVSTSIRTEINYYLDNPHRYDWNLYNDQRFNLIERDDETFLKFLCEMLHPIVRPDAFEVLHLLKTFNQYLAFDGWEIFEIMRIGDKPISSVRQLPHFSVNKSEIVMRELDTVRVRQTITSMEFNSLVFFATAWGSRHGGINSFNYDLCKALGKLLNEPDHPNLKVVCIVNEATSTEVEEAKSLGIQLLFIPHHNEFALDVENVICRLKGSEVKPVYILGHDVHTGGRAINLAEALDIPAAVFHHMDYSAYKSFQGKSNREQFSHQDSILKKADTVFAIGPKLEESAKDKIRGSNKEVHVIKVQPGLAEIKPVEMPSRFSAITFGRMDQENALLKQTDLVVASFGKAVNNSANPLGQDPQLLVIGLSNEEIIEGNLSLKSSGEIYAKRAVSICGWTYNENREELFNELRGKTVCMMLSIHEGFGLVGLEAISAEVPLILSKNTGLYNAIDQELGGEGTGCLYHVDISGSYGDKSFQDTDIEQVESCLYKIANDKAKAKLNAKKLKEKLSELWTWENTARQVLTELEDILKSTHSSDIVEILKMDSRTIQENLLDIKQQGNLEACCQAIYETDIWLEKHPDEPYIRSKYLALVREKGSLEQQQRSIVKMSHWLQENLENCDSYVFTEYLKLIRNSEIPKEQCHEAIVQSSTWLSKHPDESYVLSQYLVLVREKGKPEQSQEAISQMALWLDEHITDCDSYVFWEYLKLINKEGRSQQKQKAITQSDIWFQKHPNDSYVRSEYLKLMRNQG